jgi:hypothetical protein
MVRSTISPPHRALHEAGCTTKIATIDARAVEDLPRISTASVFVYKVHFWELSYYSACTRQGAVRVVIVELVSSFLDVRRRGEYF